MINVFRRHRRVSVIKKEANKSPDIRGYEEVWINNRGQVTYWDNKGETVTKQISGDNSEEPFFDRDLDIIRPSYIYSPTRNLLNWADELMSELQDLDRDYLSDRRAREPRASDRVIDAKVVQVKDSKSSIKTDVKNLWRKTKTKAKKLGKRLNSACKAAWRELTN